MTVRLLNRDLECQQAVELVTDYLEGALTPRQRRRFERHIRRCPNCRAYLEQMRLTIAAAAAGAPIELPDAETRDDLVQLFRRVRRDSPDA